MLTPVHEIKGENNKLEIYLRVKKTQREVSSFREYEITHVFQFYPSQQPITSC